MPSDFSLVKLTKCIFYVASPPMDLDGTQLPTQFKPSVTSTQAPSRLKQRNVATPFPDLISPVKMVAVTDIQKHGIYKRIE